MLCPATGEDVSPASDGSVLKSTLVEGQGWESPNDRATVTSTNTCLFCLHCVSKSTMISTVNSMHGAECASCHFLELLELHVHLHVRVHVLEVKLASEVMHKMYIDLYLNFMQNV